MVHATCTAYKLEYAALSCPFPVQFLYKARYVIWYMLHVPRTSLIVLPVQITIAIVLNHNTDSYTFCTLLQAEHPESTVQYIVQTLVQQMFAHYCKHLFEHI